MMHTTNYQFVIPTVTTYFSLLQEVISGTRAVMQNFAVRGVNFKNIITVSKIVYC
jgi:hypothetical protein